MDGDACTECGTMPGCLPRLCRGFGFESEAGDPRLEQVTPRDGAAILRGEEPG